jgi:hypothetical protein
MTALKPEFGTRWTALDFASWHFLKGPPAIQGTDPASARHWHLEKQMELSKSADGVDPVETLSVYSVGNQSRPSNGPVAVRTAIWHPWQAWRERRTADVEFLDFLSDEIHVVPYNTIERVDELARQLLGALRTDEYYPVQPTHNEDRAGGLRWIGAKLSSFRTSIHFDVDVRLLPALTQAHNELWDLLTADGPQVVDWEERWDVEPEMIFRSLKSAAP